jgi:CBS domain-containing protein
MRCDELMTREVAFCSPEDRADGAAMLMRKRKVGALPVVGVDNRPMGMITDRDLAITICAEADDSYYKKVKEIMRSPAICCNESDEISAAAEIMATHGIRRVPVVDGQGKLAGMITADDLARTLEPESFRHLLSSVAALRIRA